MEEKKIERFLVKRIKEQGGLCLKFISPSMSGVPDRIVLLPKGRVFFVETKSTGKKPRKLQTAVHHDFQKLGFKVFIMDSKQEVDKAVKEMIEFGVYTAQVSGDSNKQNI